MAPRYSKSYKNNNNEPLTSFKNLHIFWCTKEYDEDYISVLRERESQRMKFHFQSPQIADRPRLVNSMRNIASKKGLDIFSIHLAVYLLDCYMDNYNIISDKLQLIALVSLLLATKFEERDNNVLKATELNELVHNKYSLSDYYAIEILILKHLKWNLLLPSAVHFVHIYIQFLFTEDDFRDELIKSETEIWVEARFIIIKYLDLIMEDIQLMQEKPSKVAAAIMSITRHEMGFSKIWPKNLRTITGYKLFEMKSINARFKRLIN